MLSRHEEKYIISYRQYAILKQRAMELLTPGKVGIPFVASDMTNEAGETIESAPHPMMRFTMRTDVPVRAGDIVRAGDAETDV